MKIPMKCPYGKLTTIASIGVISSNEPRKDICSTTALTITKCPVATGFDTSIMNAYRAQNEKD